MPDIKKRIYDAMPPVVRSAMASARGYQLRSWRFGEHTDTWIADTLARDTWSGEQWRTYQQEKLTALLERAATHVPYYRQHWQARRQQGDDSPHTDLSNWPILTKEALRENPRAFVADDCDPNKMYHLHTSGTTGKPLELWWSKHTTQFWYAVWEARLRRWYGVTRHDRWAMLGGQLIVPVETQKPPFWVWNNAMHQLYMSSYHLAPQFVPLYLDAMRRYQVRFIHAYTSSVYVLAEAIEQQQLQAPQLSAIVTNAEPLFDYQRQLIERAFGCPVYETYGMAEAVAAGSQCEHGVNHIWPEIGIIETLDADGQPVADGETGDFVCTSLINPDMPLIRYRMGDRGAVSSLDVATCACGRSLPYFKHIEGRIDDLLYTADGRRIGRLDPVFKTNMPLREAQIVQDALDLVRVRVVPTAGYGPETEAMIAARLRERMGDVRVEFEQLDDIPRTKNGKFRAVVCNLSEEDRQRVQA